MLAALYASSLSAEGSEPSQRQESLAQSSGTAGEEKNRSPFPPHSPWYLTLSSAILRLKMANTRLLLGLKNRRKLRFSEFWNWSVSWERQTGRKEVWLKQNAWHIVGNHIYPLTVLSKKNARVIRRIYIFFGVLVTRDNENNFPICELSLKCKAGCVGKEMGGGERIWRYSLSPGSTGTACVPDLMMFPLAMNWNEKPTRKQPFEPNTLLNIVLPTRPAFCPWISARENQWPENQRIKGNMGKKARWRCTGNSYIPGFLTTFRLPMNSKYIL